MHRIEDAPMQLRSERHLPTAPRFRAGLIVATSMKHSLAGCFIVAALTIWTSSPVHAAGNINAKIMLNALSLTTKNPCTRALNLPLACTGYEAGTSNLALYPTTLSVSIDYSGIGEAAYYCVKAVTVEGVVPMTPTTWTGIKSLTRQGVTKP
ncbi:MAG TPA: hypothetical protein VF720_08205 [Candidatus Eisenbacteria bacterium]